MTKKQKKIIAALTAFATSLIAFFVIRGVFSEAEATALTPAVLAGIALLAALWEPQGK